MSKQNVTVIHIAPTPFFADRGCHIRIRNEIEALRGYPMRTLVCTYHLGNNVENIEIRRILPVPGYHKLDAGYSPFKFPADILLFFLVLKIAWRERPEILHGHLHEGGLIGWAVKTCLFWRRMKLVMDTQGSLTGELVGYGTLDARQLLTRFVALVEGLICRLPDFFLCSSRASRSSLTDCFRVPHKKTMLLEDVVPESFFTSHDVAALRERKSLPLDKKIILYTGSLLPGKGVHHLLEAMSFLCDERDDIFFVLVGYPVEEAETFVRDHDLADRVRMTGQVAYHDLAGWLAIGDVAVEPKENDSGEASGKLLHYLAAGLPVACFATPNNRKLLGDNGWYAEETTPDALATAITAILADPTNADRRAEQGRAIVREHYSMTGVGKRLQQVYQRLYSS